MSTEERKIVLSDVLSCPDAAKAWKISDSMVKRYATEQRFLSDEARKMGKNWIITKQGMERVFGPQPATKECTE